MFELLCFIIGVVISIVTNPLFNFLGISGLLLGFLIYLLGGIIIGKIFSMGGWKKKSILFGIGPICIGLVEHFISNLAQDKGDIDLWLFFIFSLIITINVPLSYIGAKLGSGNVISYEKFKEKISRGDRV